MAGVTPLPRWFPTVIEKLPGAGGALDGRDNILADVLALDDLGDARADVLAHDRRGADVVALDGRGADVLAHDRRGADVVADDRRGDVRADVLAPGRPG